MVDYSKIVGSVASLDMPNIDTDMIIPKEYLKTLTPDGLGKYLFSELRFNSQGSENPDFSLNKTKNRDASILVAGDNFGCGSSREHAVWALKDFGIKAVIATDFADIFYNNSFKSGLLLIKVNRKELEKIKKYDQCGTKGELKIDIKSQAISLIDGSIINFELDQYRKKRFLNQDIDDIELTLKDKELISDYEAKLKKKAQWI